MAETQASDPSAPFFEAAARGVLLIKSCGGCGTALVPAAEFCAECLSENLSWREASGRATLFTYTIMHQKVPGFEDRVPFPIAVVELAEGPRMYSTVVGCANDRLQVGMPLVVTFDGPQGESPIPKFRPA
jgi:uncharacterized OB-fold protein